MRGWYMKDIKLIVETCIILHNMTVENRQSNYTFNDANNNWDDQAELEQALENKEPVGSIFMEEDGAVGNQIANLLAQRVSNLSDNIED